MRLITEPTIRQLQFGFSKCGITWTRRKDDAPFAIKFRVGRYALRLAWKIDGEPTVKVTRLAGLVRAGHRARPLLCQLRQRERG